MVCKLYLFDADTADLKCFYLTHLHPECVTIVVTCPVFSMKEFHQTEIHWEGLNAKDRLFNEELWLRGLKDAVFTLSC